MVREELGSLADQWKDLRFSDKSEPGSVDGVVDEELSGLNLKIVGLFGKFQVYRLSILCIGLIFMCFSFVGF